MTTTFEMTWEDPGPARVGRPGDSHLRQVLAELQKHPGRWAKVAESKANGGQGSWWKKQGCEATTRRDRERGVTATYARWPEPDLDDPRPAGAPDERAERVAPAPQEPAQVVPAAKLTQEPEAEPAAEPGQEPAQVEPAPVPAPAPAAAPSKGGRMSNAECDAILDARLAGATLDDLSERFGRAVATIRSAIHRAEDRRQKAEDTARPTPLVASQPKGTCRVCHAKNRGLTDGVCRLCIIRAREAAARREDAS
ncbi:hypothetical protein NGH33_01955 [Micrococcus yunnanensis]|nr:hypothetical protein [Micrococcus yunnanensis]MCO0632739.1 hypothetical protein [Micrococcus yunnanensis]